MVALGAKILTIAIRATPVFSSTGPAREYTFDDALKLAALSVANDADQQALQELEKESTRLRTWSDWLIDQNGHLALKSLVSPEVRGTFRQPLLS